MINRKMNSSACESNVSKILASSTWQENLLSGWSGCQGKCWSTNDERREDLRRLGSVGKEGWKVRGGEEASPSGKM